MHPFWAVRRMTAKQMATASSETKPGQLPPRFNCNLQMQQLSQVSLAIMRGSSVNRTRSFEVPFLTNSKDLEEGEELILQVYEKTKEDKPSAKRTWRDADKENERKAKLAMLKKG